MDSRLDIFTSRPILFLPARVLQTPLDGVPNVVHDDSGQMFGFAAGEDAATYKDRMPGVAAEGFVLVCA